MQAAPGMVVFTTHSWSVLQGVVKQPTVLAQKADPPVVFVQNTWCHSPRQSRSRHRLAPVCNHGRRGPGIFRGGTNSSSTVDSHDTLSLRGDSQSESPRPAAPQAPLRPPLRHSPPRRRGASGERVLQLRGNRSRLRSAPRPRVTSFPIESGGGARRLARSVGTVEFLSLGRSLHTSG
jgi:hypothetical protein